MTSQKPQKKTTQNNEVDLQTSLAEISGAVGDFIRYWGFRRIHGQIWTQVYLSKRPLSGADLTRALGVSKALVSPALVELEAYGLIRNKGGDAKTKQYVANPNVTSVIRKVLKTRESALLARALKSCEKIQAIPTDSLNAGLNPKRLAALAEMIQSSKSGLEMIVSLFYNSSRSR